MRIRLLILLFLSLTVSELYSQNTNSFRFQPFTLNNDSFTGIQLQSNIELGASDINFAMMQDVLFSTRFEEENKQRYIASSVSRTNGFYAFVNDISYHIAGEKSRSISLNFNNLAFVSASSDLVKMGLFGNKRYAGDSINSPQTRLSNFAYSSLKYQEVIKNDERWFLALNGGINFIYTYRNAEAEDLKIYTETEGEYVDFETKNVRYNLESAGLDGIGFNVGFKLAYSWSEDQFIGMEVNELGANRLFSTMEYGVDTSYRFEGIPLSFDNIQSGEFIDASDSIINEVLYSDSSEKKWMTIPVNSHIYYQQAIADGQSISLSLRTRDHGYYGFTTTVAHHLERKNMILISSLQYGNFTGFNVNAQVEYKLGSFHALVAARGIASWLFPKEFSYSGFSVGVAKAL